MPWTAADAKGHTKAADTPKKQRQWAHVANSARERCIKRGGKEKECDARAIKQANAAVKAEIDKARGEGQGVGGERQGTGGPAYCVCPKCGHKTKHTPDTPCKKRMCPECNTPMAPQEKATLGYSYTFGSKEEDAYVTEHCICVKCGYQAQRKQGTACQDIKCPKCDLPMLAKERKSIPMRITKATMRDGGMYWQGVVSDDDWDKEDERLDLLIFSDFKHRLDAQRHKADYEPPFVSLSHYGRLDDSSGERGVIEDVWTHGNIFKADGWFNDDPLSVRCFEVVRDELKSISAGEEIENPVRFSVAFYPEQIAEDEGRTVYLKGILDHVALTRLPVNPRTGFTHVTEKSMTTKKEDALSIVGDEFADELDELDNKQRTQKSQVDDLVIKADEEEDSLFSIEQEKCLRASLEQAGVDKAEITEKAWDYAYKKSLPDSAYAYVEKGAGCEKKDGKTSQKCRHLPYKDKSGSIDCAHVRAALQAVGGARTGKKMSVPSGVVQKLRKALKSCQKGKAEILEIDLTEYEEGRMDGYNAALDLDISEEVTSMSDDTKEEVKTEEVKANIDLDAVLNVLKPEPVKEQKAEVKLDEIDTHVSLLRQIMSAEGHGRAKKLEVAEAVFRSFAAHVGKTINETTPASPEDVANTVGSQVREAMQPMMDKIAVLEEAVMGQRPDAPESKALSFEQKSEPFGISPVESLRIAKMGEGARGEQSPITKMVNESVGLPSDFKRQQPL